MGDSAINMQCGLRIHIVQPQRIEIFKFITSPLVSTAAGVKVQMTRTQTQHLCSDANMLAAGPVVEEDDDVEVWKN